VLVGREDHGTAADVAVVDDVIEDVRSVVAIGEIANLIDNQDVGAHVGCDRLAHLSFPACSGEVIDELCRSREERIESILQRAVRDRDREMGLSAARLAEQDCGAPFGHEVRRE
jgi:hypothetical protein